MNSSIVTVLIVVGIIWCLGLFFGVVKGIKKGFSTNQEIQSSEKLKRKEKTLAEDTEEQRKQLMEDYKQKIRDNQRRF